MVSNAQESTRSGQVALLGRRAPSLHDLSGSMPSSTTYCDSSLERLSSRLERDGCASMRLDWHADAHAIEVLTSDTVSLRLSGIEFTFQAPSSACSFPITLERAGRVRGASGRPELKQAAEAGGEA